MQSEPRILRLPEVLARTGLSRTRLYLLRQYGQFPKGHKISKRACGWRESDVSNWIEITLEKGPPTVPTDR